MAKTQWHPAFCAAMRLELKENRSLQFINEFNLTEKPLEVDMLIINKPSGGELRMRLGNFLAAIIWWNTKAPQTIISTSFPFARHWRTHIIIVTGIRRGM